MQTDVHYTVYYYICRGMFEATKRYTKFCLIDNMTCGSAFFKPALAHYVKNMPF